MSNSHSYDQYPDSGPIFWNKHLKVLSPIITHYSQVYFPIHKIIFVCVEPIILADPFWVKRSRLSSPTYKTQVYHFHLVFQRYSKSQDLKAYCAFTTLGIYPYSYLHWKCCLFYWSSHSTYISSLLPFSGPSRPNHHFPLYILVARGLMIRLH